MRTLSKGHNSTFALFGQVRQSILALLFTHSDETFYVRQIARITGGGLGAVHRELANLVKGGLITRSNKANLVFYQANLESPVFHELHDILVKTFGVADVIRNALVSVSDNIDYAFVYGSIAKGTENNCSDIDVMIVGSVDFAGIVGILNPIQDILGREINPSVFTRDEFISRLEIRDNFISSVVKGPKIFLIGDEDGIRSMG